MTTPHHTALMCRVRRIEYDFTTRTGRVFMDPQNCVNMPATIGLFARIDPQVQMIETIAGDEPDTIYRRRRRTEDWDACLHGREYTWRRPDRCSI